MTIEIEKKAISPFYTEVTKTFKPDLPRQSKADRAAAIDALIVEFDGNNYQVDEQSLLRIGLALTTASSMFIQALAANPTLSAGDVYKMVYQDTPVPWRTADDVNAQINAEALIEIVKRGSLAFTSVWFSF